jgi:UTP--glucose-1-phosphate uridylyltransferase
MDTHSIETAIIPVAGIGSRMLPATWSVEKCMLPVYIGNKTKTRLLVDWMVEECVKAGIKRIIFVTTERGKKQLSDYFEKIDQNLVTRFEDLGKDDIVAAERARRASYGVTYEYVFQQPGDAYGYGTTVPPLLAKHLLQGEKRFFLMGGDDFIYHENPEVAELSHAMKTWEEAGTDFVMMAKLVSPTEATHLGVFFTDDQGNLEKWLEKPSLEELPDAPAVFANASRYGFNDSIWDYLEQEAQTKRASEHLITYPILKALGDGHTFRIHSIQGAYLGGGTADELIASGHYIADHPQWS